MLAIFISSCSSSPKIFWGRRRDGIVSYHYFCYYCCILIDVDLSSFIFSNLFLPAIFCPPKIMLQLNCKQNRNSTCMARRISSCPEIALHSFFCVYAILTKLYETMNDARMAFCDRAAMKFNFLFSSIASSDVSWTSTFHYCV